MNQTQYLLNPILPILFPDTNDHCTQPGNSTYNVSIILLLFLITYSFTQYTQHGFPSVEDELEIVSYELQGIISTDPDQVIAAKLNLGKFILDTNEFDTVSLVHEVGKEKNT